MRIWDRLKLLVPLLMALLLAPQSNAQQPFAFQPGVPPAFLAGQNFNPGSFQGLPQSFQSQPFISPFDNALEETFNSDGLWFNRFLSNATRRREFYFNVDVVHTIPRKLEGNVGEPQVATNTQIASGAGVPAGTVTAPELDQALQTNFPFRTAADIPEIKNAGVRIGGGFEDRAGWGFSWNITYNGQASSARDFRQDLFDLRLSAADAIFLETSGGLSNGALPTNLNNIDEREIIETEILNVNPLLFDATNATTFTGLGNTFDILDRNLSGFGSIGFTTGSDVFNLASGIQFFDLDFRIEQEIESYGAGLHFSLAPFYESGNVKARTIIGGRFFRIDEGFHFFGVDSGLAFALSPADGIDDDGDFVIDNVSENTPQAFAAANLSGVLNPASELIIRSFLDSTVSSTLGGPELGVEYQLLGDDDGLQVSGSTRAGVLFNSERLRLQGDNLFPTTTVTPFDTTTTIAVNQTQNFFTDALNTTHVSPLFEQQIEAELPIFSRIPVLRDIWQLQGAKLRLGYTFTWIGEIADPSQSIQFTSDPQNGVFPTLSIDRNSFYQHQFNAGLQWDLF